ncbi:AraC family transcriptional regulator [Arenibacter sp. GZD96]|uniref:helix-turn-helix domain-containing protein n=1 Tax=Aurantibrevibacter litoralis TaxID=3106030 RepID=UPI002AFE12DC|nr:AraC family transcriptional regulator [Arenibacter sp. GZD-96]MEA1787452.1 AraC family transcriptional regulator [Arenibacter sp. GZD-96]
MDILKKLHREMIPMSAHDCFLVVERTKDYFDYPIHFHPEYELNFVWGAKGVQRIIGDSIEEITANDLVLVGPNLYHVWEQHRCTQRNIREVTVQFHQNLFDENFLNRGIMKPIKDMFARSVHGILFSQDTIKHMAPRLFGISKLDGMDYFLSLLSILYDLAISRNQRLLSTLAVQRQSAEKDHKIQLVHDYADANYERKIALSEVSELVNMSSVSFNRYIKKCTGKTFVEYLNHLRVGYAARWLSENELTISEIAFKSGFHNIANFNRIFKRIKGVTPSVYRRNFSGIKRVL